MTQDAPENGVAASGSAVRIYRRKHTWRWVTSILMIGAIALVVRAFIYGDVQWGTVFSYVTAPAILQGVVATLFISVATMAVGFALGLGAALMNLSANPVARAVALGYSWLFRGMPLLVQLMLWYNIALIVPAVSFFGLGPWRTVDLMTPLLAAFLGLALNEGAYMSEILRGAILSVNKSQVNAARALGMTPMAIQRRIVLPQAIRLAIPATGNQYVILLKGTSLASIVQYSELLHAAETIYNQNYAIMELLIVAAFWYVILTGVFSLVQAWVEKRTSRYQNQIKLTADVVPELSRLGGRNG